MCCTQFLQSGLCRVTELWWCIYYFCLYQMSDNFHSCAVHFDIIKSFIYPTRKTAKLECSRKMLKLTLKFTLKCSYMFPFNKPTSGSLLMCLAKGIIIKMVSSNYRHESVRSCGCIFVHSLLVYVQCTVQSESHNKLPDDGCVTETCRSILM